MSALVSFFFKLRKEGPLLIQFSDPIAMSVRSTNVYEENSLGIYKDKSVDENFRPVGSTAKVWGRYLAVHMRKQLSFGTDSSVWPRQIVAVTVL
jgi:hypothetical protein